MNRFPACLLFLSLIFQWSAYGQGANIYVAVSGSDRNPGSSDQPLASLSAAVRKARELRRLKDPSVKGGIHIIISGGRYHLYEPVFIRPEDAGTPDSPTFIEAAPDQRPVFSGGISINNWKPVGTTGDAPAGIKNENIWVAGIAGLDGLSDGFRQIWVNGRKAVRARYPNADTMDRILSWDHVNEQCRIPKPSSGLPENTDGLEMFIHQWWAVASLRVKEVKVAGDSVLLSFLQPESRIQSEHPWPAPWISKETGNSAYYLTNSLSFLDSPGEWYLDRAAKKLYYWPLPGEDMNRAEVIAPALETLLRIEGSIGHPVSYVFVEGLSFEHSTWLRPSQQGHVPHQAGLYMLDAYKLKTPGTAAKATLENQAWVGRPAAAVRVSFAEQTAFENCSFQHLASTGLDYGRGTRDGRISGNLFQDIGGTGILAGVFSDETTEVHLPYLPADERERCSRLQITNNLINDATNEDWGCVGIGAGYVNDITIAHNEICEVSYSGISLGWGWTRLNNAMRNNQVRANKIHHYGKQMYDVAGIYTLSAQPGTVISENYIDSIYKAPYAHIPSHWFYLYTDEGSSFITVKNNWCPSEKFLQNANGPGNRWTHNGPQAGAVIRNAAGLEPEYRYLLQKKKRMDDGFSINKERPALIELITRRGKVLDTARLRSVLKRNQVNPASLYCWEDHYVIFGDVPDQFVLTNALRDAFAGVEVKNYQEPFYEFDRSVCADTGTAAQWQHLLLTANLVADTSLQREYLEMHSSQFEKWPEVSRGFCQASFQRLLLFRQGRQLMLVISIPAGKKLEELDPLTTENNPRVVEWNKLMKKYQEGVPGTKAGEVWVFLKPLQP